jgi:hypothetical protein
MSWFKLTIPKGKRKKRAHKKWLVETGVRDWLLETQKIIEEEADIDKFQQEVCGAFIGTFTGIIAMPDGSTREVKYENIIDGVASRDLGDVKALQESTALIYSGLTSRVET